ncbi:DUF2399 domain-containing protein [Amycolatopsis sp. WAC 01416]|uniref:DUF2399 domain-containing protein n=1 Tax=Amycolatopsis sp. WAC 01416 TaxID=2203196 RepID=UPI00351A1817
MRDRISWQPWRFDAATYTATTAAGGPLTGKPADAAWDPDLRPAMEGRGVRIEEELVLPALLADLR